MNSGRAGYDDVVVTVMTAIDVVDGARS